MVAPITCLIGKSENLRKGQAWVVKLSVGERKEMKTMEGKGKYEVWYYVVRKRDEVMEGGDNVDWVDRKK